MNKWTKITSGRFLFTVITAVIFAYAVVTGKIQNDELEDIIKMVVMFYFMKRGAEVAK